jgi:hypothetical protein
MVERPDSPRDAMIMLVELLKQSGFTPEQILQKINAMSTPNDYENKKLNWNGSGAAAEDEEPNMPLQQPNKMPMQQLNMQQMEDPNKISARTNQSRGLTQQQTFGREVQGPGQVDAQMPEEMKHHPEQAFGIPGPAGAEPGTQAPSTQLNGHSGNGKFASLIALLDALEAAEQNGEKLDEDEEFTGLTAGQGAPETTGVYHDQQPPPRPSPMRRELSSTPVKLPGQDSSCAVGDARHMQERRRAPEQRLDEHLRKNGMRTEAHRAYAVDMGRKIIAKDAAMAATANGLDDFVKFCPGAGKVDLLGPATPSVRSTPAEPQLAQDAAVIWTWRFNPMTNAMEQVPVRRDQFDKR